MTLDAKVRDWLEREGFPLEMRAAKAFRQAGFEIRQSDLYEDPTTGNVREIDVSARIRSAVGFVEVSFLVECKSSKHPWVVLVSSDALKGINRLSTFALMSQQMKYRLRSEFSDISERCPWMRKDDTSGYALRKAFCDVDFGYAASMSALNAANARIRKHDVRATSVPFCASFPIIVVNTPIFECSLEPTGELALTQVEQAEIVVSAAIPNHMVTCIKVVHIDALDRFASECAIVSSVLLQVSESWEVDEL